MIPQPILEGGDLHLGRSFKGPGEAEANCPCPKAACGLIAASDVAEDCPQHSTKAGKTIRTMHWEFDCPGAPS